MMLRDLIQAMLERRRQLPRRGDGRGADPPHNAQDRSGRRVGGARVPLDISEDGGALVDATDAVEVRAGHAIRGREDIVRDNHLRALRVRLVQRTDEPKVGLALRELVAPVERGPVEVVQMHPAGVPMLQAHQAVLHVQALLVRIPAVPLGQLLRRARREGPPDITRPHLLEDVANPPPRRGPIAEPLARRGPHLRHDSLCGRLRGVRPGQIHHHVGVDHRLNVWIGTLRVHRGDAVGSREARCVLRPRQRLERRCQRRRLR
mmetsp:Transcript_52477/g.151193  ORF Transcript_52477/g.151193 Transcript_52477/m.151193 type:complete len:262 (-) Transcript_52477:344-1129(-)